MPRLDFISGRHGYPGDTGRGGRLRRAGALRVSCLLALLALGLIGCRTITVRANDRSAPSLSARMLSPGDFGATYTDRQGGSVGNVINPRRPFDIVVPSDRRGVLLLFTAVDGQSGIRSLSGRVEVDFTCRARVGGAVMNNKGLNVVFSDRIFTPARSGASVPDRNSVAVAFTLEDLWRRGGCTNWGEYGGGIHQGQLLGISVHYSAEAANNVSILAPVFAGDFTISNASVNLDR